MNGIILLSGLSSVIAGVIVIAWKRSLNWVVGIWLILNGLLGLIPNL